jgi:outer membrane protein OmpA-like peptidoglycan-associated protein
LSEEAEEAFQRAAEAEAAALEAEAAEAAATEALSFVPVEVPEVPEEAVQAITELLTAPVEEAASGADLATAAAAAAAVLGAAQGGEATATPAPGTPAPAAVVEQEITPADTRQSFQDFAPAPQVLEDGRRSGLSDLERAGLLALGALAIGTMIGGGRQVVNNTGDRVVLQEPDGRYTVYRDDDTLLRRPGSNVRTETYSDGSSRTFVLRPDGTEVVTIRDATGRVLRRAAYDAQGREVVLIDDLIPEQRIDVSRLPAPRPDRLTISARDGNPALRAELARIEAERIGRGFSLRQIREVKEVRQLAAVIDVDNITFDSGSAVIRTSEARKLADLGRIMEDLLELNPHEVFLIEGHTDAVGSAASNLTLSDRRAESVALALTEYFGIRPENMVVQGYGEYDLRINTQADERLNRRVAVRVITPLLQTAAR